MTHKLVSLLSALSVSAFSSRQPCVIYNVLQANVCVLPSLLLLPVLNFSLSLSSNHSFIFCKTAAQTSLQHCTSSGCPKNQTGCRNLQLSGAPKTVVHPSKRQRLSLVGGGGDFFTLPKRSQMFPALNPALSPEDGNLLLGQSLVAAYIATMQVRWLQRPI